MLHMMFKRGQCAQKKWGRLRRFDYLAEAVTGISFKGGFDQIAAWFNRANTTFDSNSRTGVR